MGQNQDEVVETISTARAEARNNLAEVMGGGLGAAISTEADNSTSPADVGNGVASHGEGVEDHNEASEVPPSAEASGDGHEDGEEEDHDLCAVYEKDHSQEEHEGGRPSGVPEVLAALMMGGRPQTRPGNNVGDLLSSLEKLREAMLPPAEAADQKAGRLLKALENRAYGMVDKLIAVCNSAMDDISRVLSIAPADTRENVIGQLDAWVKRMQKDMPELRALDIAEGRATAAGPVVVPPKPTVEEGHSEDSATAP